MSRVSSSLIVFPNGEVYRRWGECDGCVRPEVETAQCCQYVYLPDRPLTGDEAGWLALHGLDISAERNVRIDAPCWMLEDGQCAVYGTTIRPDLCNRFPEHPSQLDSGCAYQFEKVKGLP